MAASLATQAGIDVSSTGELADLLLWFDAIITILACVARINALPEVAEDAVATQQAVRHPSTPASTEVFEQRMFVAGLVSVYYKMFDTIPGRRLVTMADLQAGQSAAAQNELEQLHDALYAMRNRLFNHYNDMREFLIIPGPAGQRPTFKFVEKQSTCFTAGCLEGPTKAAFGHVSNRFAAILGKPPLTVTLVINEDSPERKRALAHARELERQNQTKIRAAKGSDADVQKLALLRSALLDLFGVRAGLPACRREGRSRFGLVLLIGCFATMRKVWESLDDRKTGGAMLRLLKFTPHDVELAQEIERFRSFAYCHAVKQDDLLKVDVRGATISYAEFARMHEWEALVNKLLKTVSAAIADLEDRVADRLANGTLQLTQLRFVFVPGLYRDRLEIEEEGTGMSSLFG